MKKVWESPKIEVQQFTANEYVAACGDQHKVYKFTCTADAGTLYYYPTSDGEIDGNYTGSGNAVAIGSYHPCEASHEAPTTADYYDGYVANTVWVGGMFSGHWETTKTPVIVWRGENNNNGHATDNLDMDAWETAKS